MLDHNDQVTFSVDGWDNDSNNQYRVNSDFDSIVLGIKSLRASSECLIQWSTIYFAFNQNKIDDIKTLAKSLGCDRFQTVKSSKFDGRYLTNGIDVLKPTPNHVSETLLYDTAVENFSITKYTPMPVPVPGTPHKWARCLNYKKDLFIGIDGIVQPCPWFNNGYQNNNFIKENYSQLSIKTRSFFEIVNDVALWQKLIDSFDHNPLEICLLKCKNGQQ
jgi:MoaA/NifB/PqqE/SkfB family radical SAM enzyme